MNLSTGNTSDTLPPTPSLDSITCAYSEIDTPYHLTIVGSVRVISKRRSPGSGKPIGGPRGAICGLSPASARRLRDRLTAIDVQAFMGGLWVGLSYPAVYPDVATAKRHLNLLLKRLRYRWP